MRPLGDTRLDERATPSYRRHIRSVTVATAIKVSALILLVAFAISCRTKVDEQAQAALVAGASEGDVDTMKRALKQGALVNEEWFLATPLAYAVLNKHLNAVTFLVEQGADVNVHYGLPQRTALMTAAEAGDVSIVQYLVQAGASINAKNKFGRTALYHARSGMFRTEGGSEAAANYLASQGAVE